MKTVQCMPACKTEYDDDDDDVQLFNLMETDLSSSLGINKSNLALIFIF